jgi:hypothetical protein
VVPLLVRPEEDVWPLPPLPPLEVVGFSAGKNGARELSLQAAPKISRSPEQMHARETCLKGIGVD